MKQIICRLAALAGAVLLLTACGCGKGTYVTQYFETSRGSAWLDGPEVTMINSESELQDFYRENQLDYRLNYVYGSRGFGDLQDYLDGYQSAFFESHTLAVIILRSEKGVSYRVNRVVMDSGDGIDVEIWRERPEETDSEETFHLILLPMDKTAVPGEQVTLKFADK